jgi:hypothetical protein
MDKAKYEAGATLRTGQRVSHRDSEELGTIVEADGEVKVKCDSVRTL